MLEKLTRPERLLLLQFLCAFAWTDLKVSDAERRFVMKIVDRLGLDAEDTAQVEEWLSLAPAPAALDPVSIPTGHRRLFLDTIRALVFTDGVDPEERESLERLRRILGA